jgi:hypothetical protein
MRPPTTATIMFFSFIISAPSSEFEFRWFKRGSTRNVAADEARIRGELSPEG